MGRNRPTDQPKKPRKRKVKVNLVFDEAKRKDFLGGFHKRKLERKKKAQEEFEAKLKEERKRIKQELKDSYKKMVVSRRNIPELEELLSNDYETEDVTVKVVELSTNEIAERNNWIGPNKAPCEKKAEESNDDEDESSYDEIKGMELKHKKAKKSKDSDEGEEIEKEEPVGGIQSKKDLNKMMMRTATKKVQKSKTFQAKNKMERIKNKKKSKLLKHKKKKQASKLGKARHRLNSHKK